MFFDTWWSVSRVVVAGVCAYAALVVMLRISGKRTLSKMNAFDLVVTVALGSTLSSVVTSKDVAIVDGLVALGLLIGLQYLVAWVSSRWSAVAAAVKSEPRLVFHRGRFARAAMRAERLTEGEILASIRASAVPRLEDVEAVILESNGDLVVVRKAADDAEPRSVLRGVRIGGVPPQA
jgi:uncharacterized membrane protein YcaP (DUF421 family)